MAVANRRLGHLGGQRLDEAQGNYAYFGVLVELVFQVSDEHSVGTALALYNEPVRRACGSHDYGYTGHAFVSDHGNFGGRAFPRHMKNSNNAVDGKVDVFNGLVRFVNHVPRGQFDQSQLWENTLAGIFRQGSKKSVLQWAGYVTHLNPFRQWLLARSLPAWRLHLRPDAPIRDYPHNHKSINSRLM
jgi:hypothetical protein